MFQEPKPAPPPITETERYLTWFAQYSDEMEHVRCFYQQNTAAFALVCARDAMKELADYQDGDLLFDRVSTLCQYYHGQVGPLVERRGGLVDCPKELRILAVHMISRTTLLFEVLTKKFQHPETIKLLALADPRQ